MQSRILGRTLLAATVIGSMGLGYLAGTAQSAGNETVQRLDQSGDLLKKARALLGATVTRQGVGNIDKAKADIDDALNEIAKARTANGG